MSTLTACGTAVFPILFKIFLKLPRWRRPTTSLLINSSPFTVDLPFLPTSSFQLPEYNLKPFKHAAFTACRQPSVGPLHDPRTTNYALTTAFTCQRLQLYVGLRASARVHKRAAVQEYASDKYRNTQLSSTIRVNRHSDRKGTTANGAEPVRWYFQPVRGRRAQRPLTGEIGSTLKNVQVAY